MPDHSAPRNVAGRPEDQVNHLKLQGCCSAERGIAVLSQCSDYGWEHSINHQNMPPVAARPSVDPRLMQVLHFEDLQVGMREVLMKTVMDTDVIGFAELSGDNNPIHLCDNYAATTKFGQRIAHGLYTASLISAVLGTRLPGPGAVYRSQTLNFHGPVRIGDVVTVMVEVIELVPEGRKVRLHCEASVDGKVVLDGEAVVSVQARKPVPR
jgi:3-hydroxybutyryl-CoA dehydratase